MNVELQPQINALIFERLDDEAKVSNPVRQKNIEYVIKKLKKGSCEPFLNHCNSGFKNLPVCEALTFTTCSGVPSATIIPPPEPPSGPKSTTQSAVLITSRLCSITTMVLPLSRSWCRMSSSLAIS